VVESLDDRIKVTVWQLLEEQADRPG